MRDFLFLSFLLLLEGIKVCTTYDSSLPLPHSPHWPNKTSISAEVVLRGSPSTVLPLNDPGKVVNDLGTPQLKLSAPWLIP
jgi:hypothetical protein